MKKNIPTLPMADLHHLNAAEGWLGLGDWQSADDELEAITPELRAHPEVLEVRWQVHAVAKRWEACVQIATTLAELAPDRPSGWIHRSFALHELKRTQEELAKTQNDLRQMTTERDVATNRIAELTATLAERDRTIEEQKTKIAELTEEKDRLSQKIDEQTAQIGKLKDEKQDMETKMVADKRHIKELEKKIDEMMHPENMPKGIQGQVMVINSNYNFVVVDIPPGSRLYKGVELIVQREAIFVGKIRITDVKPDENFAVGDIMTDLLQVPVQVGDFIFN